MDYKQWARENKSTIESISNKYSGSFVKALMVAFLYADMSNTEILLNTFPHYFEEIYNMHKIINQKRKE